jgi:hypothetical protein
MVAGCSGQFIQCLLLEFLEQAPLPCGWPMVLARVRREIHPMADGQRQLPSCVRVRSTQAYGAYRSKFGYLRCLPMPLADGFRGYRSGYRFL